MYRPSPERGFDVYRASPDRGSGIYRASPDPDSVEIKDSAAKYEQERIQVLQQERVHVQKKTFTKWCNSFLEKVHLQINDLFTDLSDGKLLMKLLEIISGEQLGRPNKGVLRVQKMENVNRCLQFLATKVTFENIGAEDIVDGNSRLILGLIWTIILRFQIQDIVIEVDEFETSEKKSAKDALLLWCQKKTEGYRGVKIDNFSTSWRNGLGFNALIHAHRPDLINFEALNPNDHIANLNNAFNIAEDKLGIRRLLDAEDVDVPRPDDKSIMTYVASYYHYFAKMKSELTGTKRVARVIGNVIDLERSQEDYERLVTNLLNWINSKVVDLNDRNFSNSLDGIKGDMVKFTDFRVQEKPPKYKERGNIEVQFFNIQARLKSGGRRMYVPPEGKLIRDIESAWTKMEKAEHDRELALREELIRQERLQQLAEKFERKAELRDSWLTDMISVLSDQNFGNNTRQVEASLKKHEAIAADIESRRDRFTALTMMAQELYQENYHARDGVRKREQQIQAKWQQLMDLLEKKRKILMGFNDLLAMFREIESISVEMKDLEPALKSEETGKHVLGVEDLLQKHNLMESQLNGIGNRIRSLNKRAQPYMKSLHPETQLLQKRLEPLNKEYEIVQHLCQARKAALEQSLRYYQFIQDSEEEEAWLVERISLMKSQDVGKDLITCMMLIKRHEALEQEIKAREAHCNDLYQVGDSLINSKHSASSDIRQRIASLRDKWQKLKDLVNQRRTRLEDAAESHQYYTDANEAESWIREKMPLVTSKDFGKDEPSAKNLLQRHNHLEEEIKAFADDIKRLDEQASAMTKAAASAPLSLAKKSPTTLSAPTAAVDDDDEEQFEEDFEEVPYTYEVEEVQEQEVLKEEVVERSVPQIRASFAYKGNNMEMEKGETLLLIQKTNNDWWSARRANGQEGYVPANYVKEVEPKVIRKVVKKPVKVPVKVMVQKTGVRKELVKKKRTPSSKLRRTPSARSQANLHFDRINVDQRQKAINNSYKELNQLSQVRRKELEDAIVFFRFCRECDNFETWMNDKEQIMLTKDSLAENMEAVKKKYEMLLTDMAANSHTIDDINKMADNMIAANHGQSKYIQKRRTDINNKWKNLNNLKMQKEKSLAGASGIELFQKMCDELKDWIGEKTSGINLDDVGKDLASVQALQRKHQNLEQELKPIEDKLNKMNMMANAVRQSYPDEAGHINQREKEIMDMWNALKDKAKRHKKLLDDAEEQFRFKEEAKDLGFIAVRGEGKKQAAGQKAGAAGEPGSESAPNDFEKNENFIVDIKSKLREKEVPHDLAEAEDLLKQHMELKDEIMAGRERYKKLEALAQKILAKNPNATDVLDKLKQLAAEQDQMEAMWDKKNKELTDARDLQSFLREAEQIESLAASQDAFLDFDDLGSTIDDVAALRKRHEDFANKLKAQDEKMKALDELADRLIREGHPDAKLIDARRNELKARRNKALQKCSEREKQLQDAQALQEFKRDADELSDWIKEKYAMAVDESYRDLTNLLPKLQKHQALEAEIGKNKVRLNGLNQTGNQMVSDKHYATPEIKQVLGTVNKQWDELDEKAKDKGKKLREAAQQELFNKALEDANAKLDEMERLVNSDDIGKDLRGVRSLLHKHQMLENEMAMNAENLKNIVAQGNEMARAGHFDSAAILRAVKDFDQRFNDLQGPMKKRRQKLEDSMKWHQFNFDANCEQQWINEHRPAAISTDYGKNLSDAQNNQAKQKKFDLELQGHQPIVDKVLATGNGLVTSKHFATPAINQKMAELSSDWNELLNQAGNRKNNVDLALQRQKYLTEANDVQIWLNEKKQQLAKDDSPRDEKTADKLLTKHKVLDSELKAYKGIVQTLGNEADKLKKIDPVNAKEIAAKQTDLETQMAELDKRCADRRRKLEASRSFHEFMRESNDLDQWINEQKVVALSEEYGQDYEHLQTIQNKFSEFQLGIDSGSQRFDRVDKMATELIDEQNPNSATILERQEDLRKAWQQLLEQVETRDRKLYGAGELHRFNRDVEDCLSRISEKYQSIPDDLGRDLRAVQSYIKKQEGFENDLLPLEAQLQVLSDDAARLQEAYPGGNAEHIAHQHSVVIDNWEILQERTQQRKSDLQAQMDLYWFMSAVKNLLTWADQVIIEINQDEPVRNVAGVSERQKRHQELKAEIDARDDTFNSVVNSGHAMIENGHFAAKDIQERVQDLLDERDKLHLTWQQKKQKLDDLLNQQVFVRDAHQLEVLSNSQEAYLKGTETGSTVDQMEALIKKHDAFESLLATQDVKLDSLKEFGEKLVADGHFDSKNIRRTLDNVVSRRQNIKDMSKEKREKLNDSLLYANFNRDVAEAESWIEDKLKIAREESFNNVRDIQEKMKSLKKHQAFEAEIMANAERIRAIKQAGELLLKKHHEATPEIQKRVNALIVKWNELLQASNERGKGLEEARDILKYNEEVEKIEAWIRDKETLVAACDLGRDYEHCLELQKKLNDTEAGVTVDEERVNAVTRLADKLITQGRTDVDFVKDKRESLLTKWHNVQGALDAHRKRLDISLEIHAFNRDVDDIDDRINEKAAIVSAPFSVGSSTDDSAILSPSPSPLSRSSRNPMDGTDHSEHKALRLRNASAVSVEDYGRDLAAIQALQRKQEDVEKDMTALYQQIQKMESVYGKLCKKYPDMAKKSEKKLEDVRVNWTHLEDLANARRLKLEDAYQLHRFLTDSKEHTTWCQALVTTMNAGSVANSVLEAEQQLQAHLERKTEIVGRYSHYVALKERGEKLISQKHISTDEVQSMVNRLERVWADLNENWESRKQKLTQLYDLQVYEDYADQADTWLSSKEAFLANDDLGNSQSSVDELLKKHDGFMTALEAQREKITTLEQLAQALLAQEHYASDEIKRRCDGVTDRMQRVQQTADARRRKLLESRTYQQFLCSIYEVSSWVSEKMQVATDESYRDPTNLQGKIQKHQAYEAELIANRKRIDAVSDEGKGLIAQNHYASKDMNEHLKHLELTWQALLAATKEKKERLNEAYEALSFNRLCDEIESWMDDVETQLSSEDHGKDIIGVNALLKKHQLLKDDLQKHKDKVQQVGDSAESFRAKSHFMAPKLSDRAKKIKVRYTMLAEPCQIRYDNLNDSLLLYTFYRDVDDELQWINEKRPIAAMEDLGTNLSTVQSLQKKHQALESEIIAREPLMEAVTSLANQMTDKRHPAEKDINSKLTDLQVRLQELKTLTADRKLKLLDAVESHTFYAEVAEANSWMQEKKPLLASRDYGRDEDTVQVLIKKLDALELDIESFNNKIVELSSLANRLVSRRHFDSENIRDQQQAVETKYHELQDLASARRHKLVEAKKLYEFHREADDILAWIADKEAVAGSEDYGTDVEHIQILQQKFDEFMRDLNASEERIKHLNALGNSLIAEKHSDGGVISRRLQEINQQWAGVKELAENRKESLVSAKKVHMFVRDADDAIEWIEEKDLLLSSEEYGQDLPTVQALTVKHQGFERDLAAINDQVEAIKRTAEMLLQQFPDAQEHIQVKYDEMDSEWNSLLNKAQLRKERLQQAESVQLYFDDYRNLCAWCNEMQARLSADELAKDVSGAEALLNRHKENKAEIDARVKDITRFTHKGRTLIAEKNFMSAEIQGKIDHLNSLFDTVTKTWQQRQILYEQSLDLELLKRDMDQLDAWLTARKPILDDTAVGDSIDTVEQLLQKHDDFEKMVFAQEERFNAIKRRTKLEESFLNQKKQEEFQRIEEEKRREKEKQDEKKRREQDRILEERRRADEARKAQDILVRRRVEVDESEAAEPRKPAIDMPPINAEVGRTPSFKDQHAPEQHRISEGAELSPVATEAKAGGLVPSEGWGDGSTPLKKVARTDSQKKEKRQRTLSLKTNKKPTVAYRISTDASPAVEMEGMLERKHELQSGGKSAPIRTWKHYYTVLCGQLLCFFKDRQAYNDQVAAAAPLALRGSSCEFANDYTKKKNVIRLSLPDKSEYLFHTHDANEMLLWQTKIQFHAALPPALQLMKFDPEYSSSHESAARTLSQGSEADGDDVRQRKLSSTSTDQPPPGHVRIKARQDVVVADLDQEPSRVTGGSRRVPAAEPADIQPPERTVGRRRSTERNASLTDAMPPALPVSVPPLPQGGGGSGDSMEYLNSSHSPREGVSVSEGGDHISSPADDGGQVTARKSYPAIPEENQQSRGIPSASGRYTYYPTSSSSAANDEPTNVRASYPMAATLPVGVTPPTYDIHVTTAGGGQASTLERDTKPTKSSKPMTAAEAAASHEKAKPMTAAEAAGSEKAPEKEKEKKKGLLGVLGIKSKKDKK